MATLGRRIREARERLGMTQEQLAATVGVEPNTVWRWENDEAEPRRAYRPQLAQILGWSEDSPSDPSAPVHPPAPRLACEPGIDALLCDIELCAREGIVGRYALLLARQDFGGLCRDKKQALQFARAYLAAIRELEQRAAEPPAVEDE